MKKRTAVFYIAFGILSPALHYIAQQAMFESSSIKADKQWTTQSVFNGKVEVDVPNGFAKMKKKTVRKHGGIRSLSLRAVEYNGFEDQDHKLVLYLTKSDFPLDSSGLKFWDFLGRYLDELKVEYEESGWYSAKGKTIYYIVSSVSSNKGEEGHRNFLLFGDYQGRLFYSRLIVPKLDGDKWNRVFRRVVLSLNFL